MTTIIPRYADRFCCPHCSGLLERPEVTPTIPLSKLAYGFVKSGDIIEREVESAGGGRYGGDSVTHKEAKLPYYCFDCNTSVLESQTLPFRDPLPDYATYEPTDAPEAANKVASFVEGVKA